MKIGIFTFHCVANYGAVLQTYCLQEVLKNMGYEVYVIDYRPDYLLKHYKTFSFDSKYYSSLFSKIKGFVRTCLVVPIRWERNKKFNKFVNTYLNLFHLDINDESNDFDAFVFGSDQIWNPKITNGFDRIYLGDFPAAKGKKLIAYAASAGSVENFSGENIDYFFSRIKKFDKVLVREKSLADYINTNISINAETVLDPVLLAGRTILEKIGLCKNFRTGKDNFLMLFQLNRNPDIANFSLKVAQKNKLKLVEFATMCESIFNRKMKQSLSVEGVLTYFKCSSYIITSSFHGTAISIIFNKQFNTISVNKCTDERAVCLLKSLGLSSRMININDNFDISDVINYDTVEKICESNRILDMDLLKSIL